MNNFIKKAAVAITAFALIACPMTDMVGNNSCIFSPVSITASATQDRSSNFNKSYTLTGNNAKDIVTVAKKQNGKTGSNLGYSEEWCADFATDCARLTGMSSSVVPYTYSGRGSCKLLYNRMINNCGAKVVTTPKAGDFVFFDWSGKKNVNNLHHVAIVTSVSGNKVTVIGGNQGSASSLYSRKVSTVTYSVNYNCIAKYVRPKYANTGTVDNSTYYGKYTGRSTSIVTALNSMKIDSSKAFRAKLAVANGIVSKTSQYTGTASQNSALLKLLKAGKLKKVSVADTVEVVKTKTYTVKSSSGAKVRTGAGTSYGQKGGLAKGSVVTYDQTKTANGYTWYHIVSVKSTSGSWGSFKGYWVANV